MRHIENARRLALYAEAAIAALAGLDDAAIAERIVRLSLAGTAWACAMSRTIGPTTSRSLERSRHGGADTGTRLASRHRSWPGCARRDGGGRGFARNSVGERFARCDAERRRPLPCRRPCPGAGRADLRRHARADRERNRRGDRSDLRSARANSRARRSGRRGRRKRRRKFRIRRSRS